MPYFCLLFVLFCFFLFFSALVISYNLNPLETVSPNWLHFTGNNKSGQDHWKSHFTIIPFSFRSSSSHCLIITRVCETGLRLKVFSPYPGLGESIFSTVNVISSLFNCNFKDSIVPVARDHQGERVNPRYRPSN